MTIFRKDTSFPFLKIARENGVAYAKVLQIAETIETGGCLEPSSLSLAAVVLAAIDAESARRAAVVAQ